MQRTSTEGRRRWPRWAVATAALVIAALIGTFLGVRAIRARECRTWQRAVSDQTAGVSGSLGGQTARQFRTEAIRRGWIDQGTRRVFRPKACSP
jgi:hypothetical protein